MKTKIYQFLFLLGLCLCSFQILSVKTAADPPYKIPVISFSDKKAVWEDDFAVDLSYMEDGLIIARGISEKKIVLRLEIDGQTSDFHISNDGTPATVPLNLGTGHYNISLMEQMEGTSYVNQLSIAADILEESTLPYLISNIYVPFNEDSQCVKTAAALRKAAWTDTEFAELVESYVWEHVHYDEDFVPDKLSEHDINPDKTLAFGKGICLDMASLITAMARSQGLPARLVFGDIIDNGASAYHAWTEIYIDNQWQILDAAMYSRSCSYQPAKWF